MVKTKDILCKVWLRRGSDGILSRRVCGGKIASHLPTEQPQISNRQTDMFGRNDRGELRHVEFQASNETGLPFRMLKYWVYFRDKYREDIQQCVFYVGGEPMRIPALFKEGGTTHVYEVVNLQDYDAEELLASTDWGDNLWALGARGEKAVVLHAILEKLTAMPPAEREASFAELAAFSGILKIEDLLKQKSEEFPMLDLDLEENKIIGPLIKKGRQEGLEKGRKEGLQGLHDILRNLLTDKFGLLPPWVEDRLSQASAEQAKLWARRVLRGNSLEEILG